MDTTNTNDQRTQDPLDSQTPEGRFSVAGYPVILPNIRDVRLRLAVVTTSLHVLGQIEFNFNLSIAQILTSLVAAATVELVITFVRQKAIVWPASALLTGNSVALILRVPGTENGDWWSMRGWYIFAAASALAIASKYLIRWKGNHIFNPSNFILVVVFLALGERRADPQILWWGPWSVGLALGFAVILIGSVVVTMQVRHMRTALSFWIPFAALISVIALSGHSITTNWHVGPLSGWAYWLTLVASPEVLVFLFYMITDPKASPRTDRGKVIFGFAIAITSAVLVSTQTGEFGTKVGILAGLVLMCPLVPWIDARVGATTPAGSSSRIDRRTVAVPAATSGAAPLSAPNPSGLFGRSTLLAAAGLVVAAGVVFAIGSFRSPGSESTEDAAAVNRRNEVAIDSDSLPKVTLDKSAARSAFRLTPELADKIATDTAIDLLLEARSFAHLDSRLASAGLAGSRLATINKAIRQLYKDSSAPRPDEITYDFRSATVTLFKVNDGPQTPPELAVRLKGDASGPKGSTTFDHWFTVVEIEGFYLVKGAFDAQRRPVGPAPLDGRITNAVPNADDGDTPVADVAQRATSAELAGLSLTDRAGELGLTLQQSRYDLSEGQDFKIAGAAVGDMNGDGLPDILLTRVGYPNALYRNDGGHFTDVTVDAGLSTVSTGTAIAGGSTAAAFADVNGDGHPDLMTLGLLNEPNHLYLNNGDGTFADRTGEWGFPVGNSGKVSTTSLQIGLAVSDFDRDGHLDVLITAAEPTRVQRVLSENKIDAADVCSADARGLVNALEPVPSATVLLRNTGNGFENATAALGVEPSRLSAAGARFVDLDGDGWDDLVITGDSCTSKLLMNTHGAFADRTAGSGLDLVAYATGVTPIDVDRDGRVDLFLSGASYESTSGRCTNPVHGYSCSPNRLLVSTGGGRYEDRSELYQVRSSGWGWGVSSSDLNNDSLDDLFLASGIRSAGMLSLRSGSSDQARFDWNRTGAKVWVGATEGPLRSADHDSLSAAVASSSSGRSVVAADFDRDGRIDLLVANNSARPSLFMNTTTNENHWLGVELNDGASRNPAAVGATVSVTLADGRVISRRTGVEQSYQGSGPGGVHFGLGSTSTVEHITVRWPDGPTQIINHPRVDDWIHISRTPKANRK